MDTPNWKTHDDPNIYAYNLGRQDALNQRVSHAKQCLALVQLPHYNAGFVSGQEQLDAEYEATLASGFDLLPHVK